MSQPDLVELARANDALHQRVEALELQVVELQRIIEDQAAAVPSASARFAAYRERMREQERARSARPRPEDSDR